MKIKHDDLEIHNEHPFQKCKLKREQYAISLTEIVKLYKNGFVLSINNGWGTGKTTFVRMWQKHLEKNNFKTIYYNAWENDFEDNVIISVLSEMEGLIEKKTQKLFKNVVRKAAPLAKTITSQLLKTQIKKYLGDEFVKEALSQVADSVTDELHERIKSYAQKKRDIIELRKYLEKFVNEINNDLPLVFIIDELDRCRPDFAIKVLEQIKHIFSVKGIIFVLSIDKEHLCQAVKGYYGSENIAAEEYLRRFIDIEFSLPDPNTELFCNYLIEYFDFKQFFLEGDRLNYPNLRDDIRDLADFSIKLFSYCNVPLRLQEKILAHARLALKMFTPNQYVVPSLFIFLIFLKLKHPSIYSNISNSKYTYQELVDNIEEVLPKNLSEKASNTFVFMESMMLKFYQNDLESQYYTKHPLIHENLTNSKINLVIKSKIDKSEDNIRIIENIESFNRRGSNLYSVGLLYLISKIDLVVNSN